MRPGEPDPRREAVERVAAIGRPAGGSREVRRALVYLLVLSLLLAAANVVWSAHEAGATGRKFCAVVEAATAHPVPRPPDPAANPSRESNYLFYLKFVELGRSLGCG